jgi:hypothetical protein
MWSGRGTLSSVTACLKAIFQLHRGSYPSAYPNAIHLDRRHYAACRHWGTLEDSATNLGKGADKVDDLARKGEERPGAASSAKEDPTLRM